jgi:hypothetical protein
MLAPIRSTPLLKSSLPWLAIDFSRSLVSSCCSTLVICTSCWVNWLPSMGESGSWFFSCVVSSVRNISKFSASRVRLLSTFWPTAAGELAAVCTVAMIALPSDGEVHARTGAAEQALRRDGKSRRPARRC